MTAPALTALLDELDRLHRAWQEGGWDSFEAGQRLPAAVPRLTAAVRTALALADDLASWPSSRILSPHDAADRIRAALAAALGATP